MGIGNEFLENRVSLDLSTPLNSKKLPLVEVSSSELDFPLVELQEPSREEGRHSHEFVSRETEALHFEIPVAVMPVPVSFMHASRVGFRAVLLLQIGLMALAANFLYDGPAALDLGMSPSQLGVIFSAYSLPNLVMPLFAGVLTHRLGVNQASVLFGLAYLVGCIVFATSGWTSAVTGFWLRTVGRAIAGVGGEALSLARTVSISAWFEGKELAMAFGVTTTLSRSGSVLAFWLLPMLQQAWGLAVAQASLIVMVFVMIATILGIWAQDNRGKRQLAEMQAGDSIELIPLDAPPPLGPEPADPQQLLEKSNPLIPSPPSSSLHSSASLSSSLLSSSLLSSAPSSALLSPIPSSALLSPAPSSALLSPILSATPLSTSQAETRLHGVPASAPLPKILEEEPHPSALTLLKEISLAFWLLNLTSITYYLTVPSALNFIPSFLMDYRGASLTTANHIASFSRWGATLFSAVSGIAIDLIGHRGHILVVSFFLMVPGFLLWILRSIPAVLIGLVITPTYTITPSVLWPCFTMLSPPRLRALSLGIAFCSLNFALAVGPVLFGVLHDATGSWSVGLVVFAFIVLIGCLSATFLLYQDSTKLNNILRLRTVTPSTK